MPKRWRVIQTSDLGGPEAFKDYRFHWYARWIAWLSKGPSAFTGLQNYTTRIERV